MSGLVGRDAERARLESALEKACDGAGSLVLLSGEAGVGKTRLTAELAARATTVLRGTATHGGSAPYAPVIAVLRGLLRTEPRAFEGCGPLKRQLALLLPELGDPAPAADRPALFEALRCAFEQAGHALVVLDDLQWSDAATLELLAALVEPVRELPLLVLAAYRSDGLPRDHAIRRLRNDLRRAGRLDEIHLRALDVDETAELLAHALGEPPASGLARAIHDRAEGLPFFVEELASALRLGGAAHAGEVPLPETVRDAVLIGLSELSAERARRRGGRRRGRRALRPRARRLAVERRRAVGAGRARRRARGGHLPARAHPGGALRRRALDAAPRAAPCPRGGARGRGRAEPRPGAPLARRSRG